MRGTGGFGLLMVLAIGCGSTTPTIEEQLSSGEPVTFEEASAAVPSNIDSPLGGTRPIGSIEGDDDADGVPTFTLLEFQLCCEDAGCVFGEDRSGRKVCSCAAAGLLASVRVSACTMREAMD